MYIHITVCSYGVNGNAMDENMKTYVHSNFPYKKTRSHKVVTDLWQGCDKVVYKQHGNDKVVTTL